MDITIILFLTGVVLSIIGYMIKARVDSIEERAKTLEQHNQKHSTQQAVDDDRWKRQDITNCKVDEGQREMAVVKSQITTLHSNIDDIKTSQKEMNGKLDELLQRK
ncbi:hypothetical protein [Shewanella xiamenensis]|uniref:hypothetical protein n=1 Tax=Shewanella xiamenensis TaxID=332186 RepID=UPI0021BE09F8|nr:hypothetical protein [Shewanella xiamenensis]MCT8877408.1 hypothetical protein [Shewanella xiamenensis]